MLALVYIAPNKHPEKSYFSKCADKVYLSYLYWTNWWKCKDSSFIYQDILDYAV